MSLPVPLVFNHFRLNARVVDAAQELAAGGLTAAWRQVFGGVLDQPQTLAARPVSLRRSS